MIPLKDQDFIRQKFATELLGPVKIDYFTERGLPISVPGRTPCAYCKPTGEMLRDIDRLSDLVSLRVHIFEDEREEAHELGIERVPGTSLRARDGGVFRYYGMPGGTEFASFVESIVDISRAEVLFSEESMKALQSVKQELTVRVFVTPT
ncbi:MAG: hypothetical protein E6J42_07815 [Chloroflexi bacterium]|nr:MAG: hypothetical protein E6J42_07815 [Chloroflexota bacterium]